MCTLSWIPSRNGYWLLFTRDERRTRARARPPTVARINGTTVLAPTDGDFGGTWIGVNGAGVSATLLNRYEDTPVDPTGGQISRGLLLRSLLDARRAGGLIGRLVTMPLAPFRPFTIAATDRRGVMHLADWDGHALTRAVTRTPGLVRTSSGKDQRDAERLRAATFEGLVPPGNRPGIERLRDFHRGHLPERGAFSVCMHRDEAETQSLTELRVGRGVATMRYFAGPPCQAPLRYVRSIPLLESHR